MGEIMGTYLTFLLISLLISLLLVILLIRALKRNRSGRLRYAFQWLLPLLYSLLIIVCVGLILAPLLLDLPGMLRADYLTIRVEVSRTFPPNIFVDTAGETYYLEIGTAVEPGRTYDINYLRWSHFVKNAVPVDRLR
ncbi:MAG: hypothetical protein GX900_06900 [Clostridiaceae bacterium]|nr:hypothetical protein [Clostridiaceae bacterium]